jgi:hypothetical protein
MRALVVAGSLAAFAFLGSGLAQAQSSLPTGSAIPLPGGLSWGSSGFEFAPGPTGSAIGFDSLGSTNFPSGSFG